MSYNSETGLYEGYIYKIWNDVNDKLYIGQTTTTIEHRFSQHLCRLTLSHCALHNAIMKYGKDAFHICEISKYQSKDKKELLEILNEREKYYIDFYKSLTTENGYNLTRGGKNSAAEYVKISVDQYSVYGEYLNTFESMAEACRRTRNRENLDGVFEISNCCYGKQKTAFGYIWRIHGEPFDKYKSLSNTKVPVSVFEKDTGKLVGNYLSITEAIKELGLNPGASSRVSNHLHGKRKSVGGYIWKKWEIQ